MEPAGTESAVAAIVVAVVVLSGPLGLGSAPAEPRVDDGDARVTVVEPTGDELAMTAGRFGTGVAYLRLPALVAEVWNVSGSPELVYAVHVPALDVEARKRRVLPSDTSGRVRLALADRGLPRSVLEADAYTGRMVVRLQSFSTEHTLVNRTVTVVVSG